MKEIDVVITKHGGWPGAFSSCQASAKGSTHGPKVAAADYPVRGETLAFAAEDQAAYGAPQKTEPEDELPLV